ncbi:MAG: LPXTG cell wall anchor domain-containing protein [Enterococcus sp.]|nr:MULTISPECIES: LPXTG cell wall anchor domain-containing protein [Enterococcus]MDN6004473.1 LPXTG cell wall anchor domain-containing protein [Enterococcus sp.]MDN6218471.1 LPXTG cell wall anchor domain-containing protein [Enterococcus sp.]MDN6562652.1 LPXTG cell wall anchor domain-containing protein [Enterococcus sp.]MDN6584799.1 LPXTG cell wall anchor domain-containing protein [Enterococcus sp.]MDN6617817.1 LPXTG cell wall anchor domain-containing protein [Enterococcus sp.]
MVVFSLLVLNFPMVAFADTSESLSEKTVNSSQEQFVESASLSEESGTDPVLSVDPKENPAASTEKTVERSTSKIEATIGSSEHSVNEETIDHPTTETTVVEKRYAEEPAVSDKIEKATSAVVPQASAAVIEKAVESPSDLEEKLNKEWTAEKIRENLTGSDYGITQNELKGYSDEELTNAFKLFNRYNFDLTGMDLGSYVHVLRMVYKEHAVSWNEVEQALAFNPNNYTTTAELAQNIDQLQAYLKILYSNKEGFVPLRSFTNEEMLHILNHLSGAEDKLSYANGLFSGLVHWLYSSQEGNGPIDNGPKPVPLIQTMEKPASPIVLKDAAPQNNSNTTENRLLTEANGQKEYPKTGEKQPVIFTLIGMIMTLFAGSILLRRRLRV